MESGTPPGMLPRYAGGRDLPYPQGSDAPVRRLRRRATDGLGGHVALAPRSSSFTPTHGVGILTDVTSNVVPLTGAAAASVSGSSVGSRWFVGALGMVAGCWVLSLPLTDLDAIGSYGLVSALPALWYVGLAMLTGSFVAALSFRASDAILRGHAVGLVIVLHATPALLYGSVRSSGAWGHIGVVDYFQRGNRLWPDAPHLDASHNWPSFFTGATGLTDTAGLSSAASWAAWAPLFFQLLGVLAFVSIVRALTADRRVVWLSVWLFVLCNWVGADTFTPQAFASVLYLLVLAIVLRFFRADAVGHDVADRRVGNSTAPATGGEQASAALTRWVLLGTLMVLCAAIATSHASTPIVMTVALLGLTVSRVAAVRWLPLVAGAITVAWMATGARTYVDRAIGSTIDEFAGVSHDAATRAGSFRLEGGQQLVSLSGRVLVVAIVTVAIVGGVWLWRRGRLDRAPVILGLTPVVLLLGGSYDGEMIVQVYVLSLPFLAFLAASCCAPLLARPLSIAPVGGRVLEPATTDRRGRRRLSGGQRRVEWVRWLKPSAAVAIGGALSAGFMLAHFGKDSWRRFTADEIRAAEALYDTAPPGSLLVEGSPASPHRFANDERLAHVSIADEPLGSVRAVLRDPVHELADWLSDPRYTGAYVIITRSQKAQSDTIGPLPPGALEDVESALQESDRFDVLVSNDDATVFTLAGDRQ